jgi:anti-sigma factor RsiW
VTRHLTDEEVTCFVHGAGSGDRLAESHQHIRTCDECRERAEQVQRIDTILRVAAGDHVSTEALAAYGAGDALAADERRSIEQHLEFCARCREELELLAACDAELPEERDAEAAVPPWFDSLLAQDEPPPTTLAESPTPRSGWRTRFLWPLAAALVGIAMIVVGSVGLRHSATQPERVARLGAGSPAPPPYTERPFRLSGASHGSAPSTADAETPLEDEPVASESMPGVDTEGSPAAASDEPPDIAHLIEEESSRLSRSHYSDTEARDQPRIERAYPSRSSTGRWSREPTDDATTRLAAHVRRILGEKAEQVQAEIAGEGIDLRYRYRIEAGAWDDARLREVLRLQADELGPAMLQASSGMETVHIIAEYVCPTAEGPPRQVILEATFPRSTGRAHIE